MRFTEHVDVPDSLLKAQEDEKLVIFAGAGVSMSPPTNLPSFESLCKAVERETRQERQTGSNHKPIETIDQFLGRMETNGVRIRGIISQIINPENSQPNDFHRQIIRLFAKTSPLRIITTNFDSKLTDAANEFRGAGTDIWFGPAIPLGESFTGIVYIHGCVTRPLKELVLTDRDFSKAYLTKGWATRFLLEVFTNFTVLFLGYSHNDQIMAYLSRGLPPGTERFALTPNDEIEKWKMLQIEPIPYPLQEGDERHKCETDAVRTWAKHTQMDLVHHKEEIAQIVVAGPPRDGVQSDYLLFSLRELSTAKMFIGRARAVEWVMWFDDRGLLDSLFKGNAEISNVQDLLAIWLTDNYVLQHSDTILSLVNRHGGRLNPRIWRLIAWQAAYANTRPEPAVLGKWVMVLLLNDPGHEGMFNLLNAILSNCRYPDDRSLALLLFNYLSTPIFRTTPSLFTKADTITGAPPVDFHLTLRGNDDIIWESWCKYFLRNLDDFWRPFIPALCTHITNAYWMNLSIEKAKGDWDPMSFGRSAIEPEPDERLRESYQVLIDIARDLLKYIVQNHPMRAKSIIEEWADSGVPLLCRVALNAASIDFGEVWNPGSRLQWLIQNDFLNQSLIKHEVYFFLKAVFPLAGAEMQQVMTRAIQAIPLIDSSDSAELRNRVRDRRIYDLLLWLKEAQPNSASVVEAFDRHQRAHPDFIPREHPDYDFWISSTTAVIHQSPISADELMKHPPDANLNLILEYEASSPADDIDREGLLDQVAAAIAQTPGWGCKLAGAMLERSAWNNDVWDAIELGWRNAHISLTQIKEIVDMLRKYPAAYPSVRSIGTLLDEWLKENASKAVPFDFAPLEEFSIDYFHGLYTLPGEPVQDSGWLGNAINHPSGHVAEFWLRALSIRREYEGTSWKGLPTEYKELFTEILVGNSYAEQLARTILASRLHFLSYLDLPWIKEHLVPALDYDNGISSAEQCWNGFLFWGKMPPSLWDTFKPLFSKAAHHLRPGSEKLRERLIEYAVVLFLSDPQQTDLSWFYNMVIELAPDERRILSDHIKYILKSMDGTTTSQVWLGLLDRYWIDRLRNIPVTLDRTESGSLLECLPFLAPVFHEAVQRAREINDFDFDHTRLYSDLAKSNIVQDCPEDMLQLLIYLLSKEEDQFQHGDAVKKLYGQLESRISEEVLRPLKVQLLRLGCNID
ncbi:MAG: DUF4020 domain-containing protein [candidate division Zixibacteria bacterium]|nr:DUF4020 domain-containing protein [candidate division Zixibacteria bacterium]